MIFMASRDAFGGFAFSAFFGAKYISVVVAVMISPSLIVSSMLFFPIKTSHLLL